MTYEPKIGENHKQIAHARRNNVYYQTLESSHSVIYNLFCRFIFIKIEDLNMFPKPDYHPILFEEVCIKDNLETESNISHILETIENTMNNHNYQ